MSNLRIRSDSSPAPLRIVDNRAAAPQAVAIARVAQIDDFSPGRNAAAKLGVSLLGATATVGSIILAAGSAAANGDTVTAVVSAMAIALAGLAYTERAVSWQDRKNA